MKTFRSTATAGISAYLFAALFSGAAHATCVAKTPRFRGAHAAPVAAMLKQPALSVRPMDATAAAPEPSIAGYWYIQFVAQNQVIDDGFDLWHSDGTEVLNDTSAPSSGNVCVGVWAKIDTLTYTLKHPTWIFDDAGVNVIGVAIIREQIKLDPNGNNFTGTSTFDLYDFSGNWLDHEVSDVSGTRITAVDELPAPSTPIPGLPQAILNR
jgi:hypothetical protein